MEPYKKILAILKEAQNSLVSIAWKTLDSPQKTTPSVGPADMPHITQRQMIEYAEPVLDLFVEIARHYRNDPDSLWELYQKDPLWKLAIRKMVEMDDEDEGAFWFYHAYQNVPNNLFRIYIAEHPMIGLQRVLEMFEYGYDQDFMNLNINLKTILESSLDDSIKESLFIIDERLSHRGVLVHEKQIAKFIALLYTLSSKIVETTIEEYEVSESEAFLSLARACRTAIEFMIENNPTQTKLAIA